MWHICGHMPHMCTYGTYVHKHHICAHMPHIYGTYVGHMWHATCGDMPRIHKHHHICHIIYVAHMWQSHKHHICGHMPHMWHICGMPHVVICHIISNSQTPSHMPHHIQISTQSHPTDPAPVRELTKQQASRGKTSYFYA